MSEPRPENLFDAAGKLIQLVIDRGKWLYGHYGDHSDGSMLYRRVDDRSCCFGLYLNALGVPEEQLADKGQPANLCRVVYPDPDQSIGDQQLDASALPEQARWLISARTSKLPGASGRQVVHLGNSEVAEYMMTTNDETNIVQAARERLIAEGFGSQGITVVYIGADREPDYNPPDDEDGPDEDYEDADDDLEDDDEDGADEEPPADPRQLSLLD